ncbi:MAG: hypothetical protein N2688_07160 [Burkholderiaceae bacterium]|nr:hypothetical protein [Burkholderiaceae bacterium]
MAAGRPRRVRPRDRRRAAAPMKPHGVAMNRLCDRLQQAAAAGVVGCLGAAANAWQAGVVDGGGGHYAATVNESGHAFGQYCFVNDGLCYWILVLATTCREGERYPVLVNSDAGASSHEILCLGPFRVAGRELWRYAFVDFNAIDSVVRSGLRIGIALPLQSDQFRVVRFDLPRSNDILDRVRERALREFRSAPRRSTRDQLL